MGVTKESLDNLTQNFKGERLGEIGAGLNLTVFQKSSGNRNQMFTSHLEQMVMLNSPETPRVFTGYEQPYGQFTDSYFKTKNPLRVIDVISKFPTNPRWNYIYIVQDVITNVYDMIEVNHVEKLSEMHGYMRPQTFGDLWQPNMIIPPDTYVYRSFNHDDHDNYRYGANVKAAYISIPETEEDGIVVSESFANRMTFNQVEMTEFTLNMNDIMMNYYGDENSYKIFPDLGEEVKDGIICVRRKLDHRNVATELTDYATRRLLTSDVIFHGFGRVVDIDIFVNNIEELGSGMHRNQLFMYYTTIWNYWDHIARTLRPIINQRNSYSFKLHSLYLRARDYLDQDLKFSSSNGVFEFAMVRITTLAETGLKRGYKMTDRYGGKGVICSIWKDERMPIDEYGTRAEVVLSPAGVVSRSNIGQNYEHELNFIANRVRDKMRGTNNLETKYSLVYRFINQAQPKEAAAFQVYFQSLSPMKQSEILKEIENNGIFIHQQPFGENISYDNLKKLYKAWNVKPSKIRIQREFQERAKNRYLLRQKNLENKTYTIEEKDFDLQAFVTPHAVGDTIINEGDDGIFIENPIWTFPDENSIDGLRLETSLVPITTTREMPKFKIQTFIDADGVLVREFVSQRPVIIAEKYMIVLKHITESKFSARSIGSVNPLGLPNKTSRSETGGAFSTTPIKFGEMELYNALIRVDSDIIHEFIQTGATNPARRSKVVEKLLHGDPFKPVELSEKDLEEVNMPDDVPAKQRQVFMFCGGLDVIED